MISVLIVDDDLQLGRALTRALNAHGFESEAAGGYTEALSCLGQRNYDVVITDLRMGEKDGIDLLLALRESTSNTRPILMSAYATARDSQRALDLGAIRVLCKPFETRDVIEAIERAVDSSTGYVGVVHGLSLIDMLQMFHYGRRSLTLEVLGKTSCSVSVKDGEIVDARHGGDAGEAALRAILKLPAGSLRTRSLHHFTPSINREFQTLLLDLLRELDEQSNSFPSPSLPALSNGMTKNGWSGRLATLRPPRAEVDACCQQVVTKVDGAIACDVVDLETGQLLGAFASSEAVEGPYQLSAAPIIQLFRGGAGRSDEHGKAEAPRAEAQFDEFQLTSKDRIHFARALANRRVILMLVARRSANLALGWAQLRAAMGSMETKFAEAAARLENLGLGVEGSP